MKTRVAYILFVAALVFCSTAYAFAGNAEDSPAMQLLSSQKSAKVLSGVKMKIARPFIKRTPMGVVLDEIESMVICPIETESENDIKFIRKAKSVLTGYKLVEQINDERSQLDIYIDSPQNERFSEIIIYRSRPEPSIMLFIGNFDVESLVKVGKASEQERKDLKKYN